MRIQRITESTTSGNALDAHTALLTTSISVAIAPDVVKVCPKYLARSINHINPHAVTPLWMQERLRRSGMTSIHPVVDITNYVMLELGQPMHAFDRACIKGAINIRHARSGEQLALLNKTILPLEPQDLLIADQQQPLALAGIMGGQGSAVQHTTQHIVLEAAYFQPVQISQSCQRTHIHTDSSHRFERGVDAELPEQAMARATQLVLAICGGQPEAMVSHISTPHLPVRPTIALNLSRLHSYTGLTLQPEQVSALLQRLGCQQIQQTEATTAIQQLQYWQPPSWRFDLEQEVDLIEEVMRMTGYDQIPARLPAIPSSNQAMVRHKAKADQNSDRRQIMHDLMQHLVSHGFYQVINYSFISRARHQQFADMTQMRTANGQDNRNNNDNAEDRILPLANPISEELAIMRASLLPGLLHNLAYNLHRQKDHIKLFEYGKRYLATQKRNHSAESSAPPIEESFLLSAIVWVPDKYKNNWQTTKQPYGFFDLKGELFTAIAAIADTSALDCLPEAGHPWFHPGQYARLALAGNTAGYLGALHPRLLSDLKLGKHARVFAFEMHTDVLLTLPGTSHRKVLSKYPAIMRDITLAVTQNISYQELAQAIRIQAGEHLKSLDFINLYQDKNMDTATAIQAMSFRLVWQAADKTLKEEEITTQLQQILAHLQQAYGIGLKN